ncbi:MAG: hypothetical protein JWM05_1749, partial [Acidimicrobiales bacterium]|nr:hypothetical protein [Acidimicrobiales bacterium]
MRMGVLTRWAAPVLLTALLVASCSDGSGGRAGRPANGTTSKAPRSPRPTAWPAPPTLRALRGPATAIGADDPAAPPGLGRIVDAHGRQVLLRGVNVNSLAEYARARRDLQPTVPVTGADWDRMAAEGFTAVRLLVSWSRLEPAPGRIDAGELDRIRAAVRAAAQRGLVTVVDMHQDAWGPYVATPPGVRCPPGKQPAIGWDGAPAWATPKAGVNSCRGGSREDSELVRTAWDRFYADTGGVQRHLVAVWRRLANELAGEPGLGGYDLLNEPGVGHDNVTSVTGLERYDDRAIAAIRGGERAAKVAAKPIFFEYTVFGQAVRPGFNADPGLVFAPHIYGGSIGPLSVDQNWDYALSLAKGYGTAMWSGEYGWFDAEPTKASPKVRRYGQREDAGASAAHAAVGGAWWQWRQACGDPHSVGAPGGTPAAVIVEYQDNGCPGDRNLGVVPAWHEVVSRPYPRATPGRIASLRSDGAR